MRALYGAYVGKLYQLKRVDNTTKDISVLSAGGFAASPVQDSFCAGTTCTISIVYDQSPQHNDLPVSPPTTFMPDGGLGANATDAKITVGTHAVYGVFVTGEPNYNTVRAPNVAYRNNKTKGIATGDQPEAMYMVVDGTRFSSNCCFDYGNAETSGADDGNGTRPSIGGATRRGRLAWARGHGSAATSKNGMFKGDSGAER